MSMHRKPLTDLEREGLIAHGFERDIGKPSMLADVFRHGVAWALAATEKDAELLKGLRRLCGYVQDGSAETVSIYQDDATRDWGVRVGTAFTGRDRNYHGISFEEALEAAFKKELPPDA
ncbi:hypothetical protein [Methylocaldum sp.]|uniref:hypothetical protein n=1 Tax=Methylocaldum sp. TaxID=1969727 RepID=UPI002D4F2BB9|nr:hypothetical protein [Methylocaldum sp.]HYE38182.1 hypothetical protein [Methylocaldum sp.]